jgi:hypothetical protein
MLIKRKTVLLFALSGLIFPLIAPCQSISIKYNCVEGVILVVKDTTQKVMGEQRYTPTIDEIKQFEDVFAKTNDSSLYRLYKRQYIGYYNLKGHRKIRVILIAPSCAEEHPTWVNDELIVFDEDRIAGIIFDPLNGICGKIEIQTGGWH